MRTFSRNHKPLPELDIDPSDVPLVATLARQLPDVSDTEARGLAGFIIAAHAGLPTGGSSTASKYRAIIKRLDELGALPPPPAADGVEMTARKRRRGQAGIASLGLVGAMALGSLGVSAVAADRPSRTEIATLWTLCKPDDDELPWAA